MADITLIYGSVFGGAEALTYTLKTQVEAKGRSAEVLDAPTIADLQAAKVILVVTSTTGLGDLPDNLVPLYYQLESQFPMLTAQKFAVIAMGDASYGETYCGAGRKVEALFLELQAEKICQMLEIDACEDFDPEPVALKWLNDFLAAL